MKNWRKGAPKMAETFVFQLLTLFFMACPSKFGDGSIAKWKLVYVWGALAETLKGKLCKELCTL